MTEENQETSQQPNGQVLQGQFSPQSKSAPQDSSQAQQRQTVALAEKALRQTLGNAKVDINAAITNLSLAIVQVQGELEEIRKGQSQMGQLVMQLMQTSNALVTQLQSQGTLPTTEPTRPTSTKQPVSVPDSGAEVGGEVA